MIIWGFRQTQKILGATIAYLCERCHNTNPFQILKVTSWFTLFFIPIIPYRTEYFIMCPICSYGYGIPKQQALDIVRQVMEQNGQKNLASQNDDAPGE